MVVDVMPTVLAVLGIAVPGDVQGKSLLPLMKGGPADARRPVYMESLLPRLACGWGELRAIRVGRSGEPRARTAGPAQAAATSASETVRVSRRRRTRVRVMGSSYRTGVRCQARNRTYV